MDEEQAWRVIERERLTLADVLDGLSPQQWQAQSLCAAWTVRDVAAHLSLVGEPPPVRALVWQGVRAGGDFNRLNTAMTRIRARRTPQEIVGSLRTCAGSRAVPAVTSYRNVLFDLLVHIQDVAIPLGLDVPVPLDAARASADRVWSMGWPFHARRRLRGLRLTATDVAWSAGDGADVRGPIGALLMLLTGRTATIAQLAGEGVAALDAARTR